MQLCQSQIFLIAPKDHHLLESFPILSQFLQWLRKTPPLANWQLGIPSIAQIQNVKLNSHSWLPVGLKRNLGRKSNALRVFRLFLPLCDLSLERNMSSWWTLEVWSKFCLWTGFTTLCKKLAVSSKWQTSSDSSRKMNFAYLWIICRTRTQDRLFKAE